MRNLGYSFYEDPQEYLRSFPILSKDTIRTKFNDLKSTDLARRKWPVNTTGGSSGQPVQVIQDRDFATRAGAITLLFSRLSGREIGESEALIWGSEQDIKEGGKNWKARLINKITNTIFLNAYQMTPESMRHFTKAINVNQPKQIVAYAESLYQLARFAKQEQSKVIPPSSIITSAEMLYPFMRETIEGIFQCNIINRYGSRELGDIGCEINGIDGFWVAPWGNYLEIIDGKGNRVPDGVAGDILVTSLTNYSMPLLRYKIGDCGVLASSITPQNGKQGQILLELLGRVGDSFRTRDDKIIHSCYFRGLLFYKNWVYKYQVIQKSYSKILFRIVKTGSEFLNEDLDEIEAKTKLVMGDDCKVDFLFVENIPVSPSGKYRYVISNVQSPEGNK
jgi:phenylacetate-CoA ligase